MAHLTGKALYLIFGTSVLDTDYRAFGASETGEQVDQSAGSDAYKTYLAVLKDGTASATVLLDSGTAFTAVWAALIPNTEGTLEWAPEGTDTGHHQHKVNAFVTKRVKSMEFADVIVCDLSWQFSGSVTDSTY